jgi:outer membrane protein assembly factor BamD
MRPSAARRAAWLRLLPLLLLALLAAACARKVRELRPVDEVMAQAMRSFHKGRYVDALGRFEQMSLDYAGSALMDSVRYMEAECQYQLKEWLLAADLYEELVSRYPTSPLVDDARLRIANCWYELSPKPALDQTFTYKAIQEYQALLDDYPGSPHRALAEERIDLSRRKLAQKDLRNAELYYRMSRWPAALLYLNEILETWYDQPAVAEKALYYKALCQWRMKLGADARATAEEYLETWPAGSWADAMRDLLGSLD